jgi:hypothetical protein
MRSGCGASKGETWSRGSSVCFEGSKHGKISGSRAGVRDAEIKLSS